jgi:hypothetical protein
VRHERLFNGRALLAFVLLSGCATPEKKIVDSVLPDTAQPAAVDAAPPAPASKIGKIPLLAQLPAGGQCREQKHEGLTAIVREVTYEGDFPLRVIKVAVGQPTRSFLPVNLEGRVKKETAPGRVENETIYVVFNPDGSVQSGRREYFVSDLSSPAERQGLLQGDEEAVKQLVQSVLQQCPAT